MISVIIPTYNRAQFLCQAVDSVCSQSLAPGEIIIVDDGSTDNTRNEVARLRQKISFPVKYVFQENHGAASARNKGIRVAKHDILCFLDSDDHFMPAKLEIQYNAMLGSPNLISHTKEIWYRRGVLLKQKKKHQPLTGNIFRESLRMCMVGMSTVMIRRSVFETYGYFNESLPCCEDYDFWLRVGAKEDFLLVEEPLTVKNGGRTDQLSVLFREGMDRFRIRSLTELLRQGTLSSEQFNWALEELDRKCKIYGKGCIKHGRDEEGKKILAIPDYFRRSNAPVVAE